MDRYLLLMLAEPWPTLELLPIMVVVYEVLDTVAAKQDHESVSTPNEMARLFEMIQKREIVDDAACFEMLSVLCVTSAFLVQ